jgi:catechol 2,3-dioxygenase-like lactoylglutathione lyase family enzyme
MIDHIMVRTSDYNKSKAFYNKALRAIGYELVKEVGGMACGFGPGGVPIFWITDNKKPSQAVHIAFNAKDRKTVDAFHAEAIAAGGRDNGQPGLRPDYHPNYYGAFVFDPDGNNIEAVCHAPENPA